MTRPYRVVVPLPSLADALPRLGASPTVRRTLALAFAQDTVSAARKVRLVGEVVVATADPIVVEAATALGADILRCTSLGRPEIRESAREAFNREGLGGPTAVLDFALPCLLAIELEQALRGFAEGGLAGRPGTPARALVRRRDSRRSPGRGLPRGRPGHVRCAQGTEASWAFLEVRLTDPR